MRADQILVSAIATIVGLGVLLGACQIWSLPYRWKFIQNVDRRWGRTAATVTLWILACLLLGLAAMIALDYRPSYAR